jgi:hypothetical protein
MNKNLESFGVQELDAKEVRETDGGWWKEAIGLALAILSTDWDQAASDFSSGFRDAHR